MKKDLLGNLYTSVVSLEQWNQKEGGNQSAENGIEKRLAMKLSSFFT